MATVTIEEVQTKLKELICQMTPGEELMITDNLQTVAKRVCQPVPKSRFRPGPGLGKGMISIAAVDDEHLQDFEEFMP